MIRSLLLHFEPRCNSSMCSRKFGSRKVAVAADLKIERSGSSSGNLGGGTSPLSGYAGGGSGPASAYLAGGSPFSSATALAAYRARSMNRRSNAEDRKAAPAAAHPRSGGQEH